MKRKNKDITRGKKAEEKLRILGDLIDTASICILTTDRENRITNINQAGEKLYGYRANEIVGKDVKILFSDRNPRSLIEKLDEKALKGESWEAEVWRKRKDGSEILTWLSTSYLFDERGDVHGALGIGMDITLKKEAEEKLRILGDLIDTASICILTTDKEGKITSINRAGEEFYGYRAGEIVGKDVKILFSDRNPRSLIQKLDKKMLKGESWEAEVWRKRKDGSEILTWLSTSYLFNERAEVVGALGIARDITREKEAEEKLRILGDLIDTASICILTTNEEGKITSINRAGEKLYGYRAGEIVGKDVKMLFSDRNPRSLIEKIEEKKLNGESWEAEVWRKRKDGSDILTWLSTSYLFDERGLIKGALGIAKDITKGRETEEMLKYIAELVDSASLCIMNTDKDNRVISTNKACEKMLGYKSNEIIGRDVSALFTDETSEHLVELIREKAEKGENWDAEVFRRRRNGEVFPAWVSTFYLTDEEGQKRGAMSIMRDLSEIKKLEKDLVHAERLATLGTLAAGIAHEIRNPLAGIEMGLEALGENVKKDEENAEIIETLHDEIMRLNEVVSRLLEYGRKRSDNIQACNVGEILKKTFFFLHKQIDENQVAVEWDIQKNLRMINADGAYLQQAFMNIMLNAIQAMEGGGVLKISAKNTDLKEHGAIEVSFDDSGEGIDPADIPKIFDAFSSTKVGGTGLGLPISKKIITGYDGDIEVKSKKGQGTTVRIILPSRRK